jgi:hypothetical protein
LTLKWKTAASIAAAMILGPAAADAAELVLGVPMPKRASPDGPYRYSLPATSLRDVVKFFRKVFKRAPHTFVGPLDYHKVELVHIRSGDASTLWEGINLSLSRKRASIFVIPRKGVARVGREREPE